MFWVRLSVDVCVCVHAHAISHSQFIFKIIWKQWIYSGIDSTSYMCRNTWWCYNCTDLAIMIHLHPIMLCRQSQEILLLCQQLYLTCITYVFSIIQWSHFHIKPKSSTCIYIAQRQLKQFVILLYSSQAVLTINFVFDVLCKIVLFIPMAIPMANISFGECVGRSVVSAPFIRATNGSNFVLQSSLNYQNFNYPNT